MKRQTLGGGLVAGALSVLALTGGAGAARADDPGDPATPILDRVVTETPDVFVNQHDEGAPSKDWGGAGMYCTNMFVHCR